MSDTCGKCGSSWSWGKVEACQEEDCSITFCSSCALKSLEECSDCEEIFCNIHCKNHDCEKTKESDEEEENDQEDICASCDKPFNYDETIGCEECDYETCEKCIIEFNCGNICKKCIDKEYPREQKVITIRVKEQVEPIKKMENVTTLEFEPEKEESVYEEAEKEQVKENKKIEKIDINKPII